MTHDKFCPAPECGEDCYGYEDCFHRCICQELSVARYSERLMAGERVADLPMAGSGVINREAAINAARGEWA